MTIKKTWKEAWFSSPGPRTGKAAVLLFGKGLLMGAADVVPGVSGGTMAFITGIYEKLVNAIKSVNAVFLKMLLRFQLKEAVAEVHLRFLLPLLAGIAISLVALAGVMNYLLGHQPIYTWSVFFGLILASILLIGKQIQNIFGPAGLWVLLGVVFGYYLVGVIPVETPDTWWFIIMAGAIAISAMILPGISGSFILLILGKYEFMTGALKNPLAIDNLAIILFFLVGCVVGIIFFSRFLSWLFKHYHNFTIAFMTGLISGSLRKIWPWKKALEIKLVAGQEITIAEKNIFPPLNQEFVIALVLIVLAFGAVVFLERKSRLSVKEELV